MSAPETQRRSPYQGLIPYSEADAPFFFGREKEVRLIVANLFGSPLTLLYGASGVGKSSVLRAGLAHQLAKRADVLVLVFNAWQGNPVSDLKQSIAELANLVDHDAWTRAESLLQNRPASLAEFLAVLALQLDRHLMVILDQFEEYFLYHPQEDQFATEFSAAVTQPETRVSFLISIREDFYAKLDRFEGRIPTLYDNYLRMEHLDREAAQVAIEAPLARYNQLYVTNGQPFSIEPTLVEAVLKQVETGRVVLGEVGRGVVEAPKSPEGAAPQIETPFLQLVMTRLWDEESKAHSHNLRISTLNQLGGAENIVRTHLDDVITRLQPREQEIAASIFHYLVTPSGTKIAYTASDLAVSAKLNKAEVVQVLESLSHRDVRVLRHVDRPLARLSEPQYEIFHDVLAPAILEWRGKHAQAQELNQAKDRAREQQERAEREARSARRLRSLAACLAVLLVATITLAIFAWVQTRKARNYAAQSENLRRLGEHLSYEGTLLRTAGEKAKKEAQEERQRAVTARSEADTAKREAIAAGERSVHLAHVAATREEAAKRAEAKLLQMQDATHLQQQALYSSRTPGLEDLAIRKYLESAAKLEKLDEIYAAANAYESAADINKMPRDLKQEIDAYEKAWPLYKQSNAFKDEIGVLRKLTARYQFFRTQLFPEQPSLADIKTHERKDEAQRAYGKLGEVEKQAETLQEMARIATTYSSQVAEKDYVEALELYGKLRDQRRLKAINQLLGDVLFKAPATRQKALVHYGQARSIIIAENDKGYEIALLIHVGEQFETIDDYPSALGYFQEALNLQSRPPKSSAYEVDIFRALGTAYLHLNDRDNSLRYLENAAELIKEDSSGDDEAVVRDLARAYVHFGEPAKAINAYDGALELQRQDDATMIAQSIPTIKLIAGIYRQLGQRQEAIVHFQKLAPLYENKVELVTLGVLYDFIGQFYLELKDDQKARENLTHALSIYQDEVEDHRLPAGDPIYKRIGDVYTLLGDSEKAAEAYKKAEAVKPKTP